MLHKFIVAKLLFDRGFHYGEMVYR